MSGAHVVLAVTGGIAVYKACEVLRGLQRAGCDVRVVMTQDAERFVGTVTFEALSGYPVVTSLYGMADDPIAHITLADFADLCVVVPATANMLAKMAHGIADDALSTTLLAMHCPMLVAPAMNVHMWQNAATQDNVRLLESRGVSFVSPASGRLACGDVGEGKLAAVDDIVGGVLRLLGPAEAQDLAGLSLMVTAGPTHEKIDPVRYIANSSTGKMGYAIAAAARRRGAEVTLVSGPTSLDAPEGVRRVDVVSAAQMHEAAHEVFDVSDVAICAAAVADYTPAHPADHKLKKAHERLDVLDLVETADILADLSRQKGERIVVGFAAETNDLIENAQSKLARKGCDVIVANDVSRPDSTFGADTSRIALVDALGVEQFETMPLDEVANAILDRVARLCKERELGDCIQ